MKIMKIMKKITYLIIILLSFTTQINAAEKKNCTNIKKLSKAFIACKSGNLKVGIMSAGSSIKKNTVGKIKKKKTNNNQEQSTTSIIVDTTQSTTNKIVNVTKEKTEKVKSSIGGLFTGSAKQYPRGIK